MNERKILKEIFLFTMVCIASISCCKKDEIEPVIPVTDIKFNENAVSLNVGSQTKLISDVIPNNATNKKITWKSDDENIATVDTNGLVTGISAGTAVITVTAEDGGKTAACTVTVTATSIPVTGIAISPASINVEINKTEKITVYVLPANATNKKVSWKSDDENIATVDTNGLVTGISAGTAVITVTAKDGGKTATCTVTVTAIPNSLITWHISNSNNIEGLPAGTAQKMKDALDQIKKAKTANKFAGNKKAVIVVNGTVNPTTEGNLYNNSLVNITEAGVYPNIVLRGSSSGGTLDASNKARVLNIVNNNVIIADNITLTGGNTVVNNENYGGGVYMEKSSLEMIGGTISNCIALNGAGIYISNDKQSIHSSFSMKGGVIKNCKTKGSASKSGAGIFVDSYCSFSLSGNGLISNNGTDGNTDTGGGISVNGWAKFTMSGGEISGNKATERGGGVDIAGYGSFTISDGKITDNTAPNGGGSGVYISPYGAIFSQTGGSISGNHGNPDLKI
ncbi:MAG: Ig-like domain-containing protein [Prevotellaceae bacterium]|jgi:hypothetical protein|nr:Ig-like domain-containing protein [Prevotellaceae bacterium]